MRPPEESYPTRVNFLRVALSFYSIFHIFSSLLYSTKPTTTSVQWRFAYYFLVNLYGIRWQTR
ncbi:MAG: hypothetical protein RLZZ70_593 [Candidatus Parcubacteria bacterium]|jgi:hypothetical protein